MPIRASKPAEGAAAKTRRRRVGEAADPALARIAAETLTPEQRAALAELSAEREKLSRELADAQARIASLERLADEDALMPIANRRAFVRELTRMIAFTQRYGLSSSVVYFDVDDMKQINDAYGHPAGDAALHHIVKILRDNVRSSDIIGRLGGDEFGVILAQTSEAQANRKAAVLGEAIAAMPLRWGDVNIPVSAAYGVYSFFGNDDAHDAIKAADRAMYRHKRRARSA